MKKVFLVLLCVILSVSVFSGCGTDNNSEKDEGILSPNDVVPEGATALSVSIYQAGYGIDWLKEICKSYHRENPDIYFYLEGNVGMDGIMESRINAGGEVSDIFTCNSTSILNKLIREDKFVDMSDIFDEEVENGKSLNDILSPNIQTALRLGGGNYYLPWVTGISGIVYNSKMFEAYNWSIPETKDELFALMDQIKTDTNGSVKSMVLCGSIGGYFSLLYPNLFIQYEGKTNADTFFSFGSADVYKMPGRNGAYQVFADMLSDKSRFPSGVMGYDHMAAQTAFLNEEAAMIINGGWLETEMSEYLADPIYDGFEMKMMAMPKNYASKASDGTPLDSAGNPVTNYVIADAGGFVVPKNAVNTKEAKEFLKFIYRTENLAIYTSHAGAVLPVDYSEVSTDSMSVFKKSIVEVYKQSEIYSLFTTAPIFLAGETSMHPNNTNFAKNLWNGKSISSMINDEYDYMVKKFNSFAG